MKHYTTTQKVNAELSLRSLSDKADNLYRLTDPLDVYEIETEEGPRYDVTGCIGNYNNLTFEELQELFESEADGIEFDE